ncbi:MULTISPECIES: hypothetical protein [Nocardiopsis]|uniref:hypothetical protein n=1 Tax=Nocardiopsis TaxID=2013 RepID=UPI000348DD13|nr:MULTISPECIES: hypothetical protein [Nocardiopsis]
MTDDEPMLRCPLCTFGFVEDYRVPMPLDGSRFRMCEECEAVWEDGGDVDAASAQNLLWYLQDRGLQPWLEDVHRA